MADITGTQFKVLGHSALDGVQIDHFYTEDEARAFAKDIAAEGYTAVILEAMDVITPDFVRHDPVATPGIDHPYTLDSPRAM